MDKPSKITSSSYALNPCNTGMHYRHQDFCCCRSCFTFFLFIKLYLQIGTLLQKYNTESSRHEGVVLTTFRSRRSKTLFTWSGGPRFSGVDFFCFVSPRAWKQKKPTPLDRGRPLHVNRPLHLVWKANTLDQNNVSSHSTIERHCNSQFTKRYVS